LAVNATTGGLETALLRQSKSPTLAADLGIAE
jgi:hypothetical protein